MVSDPLQNPALQAFVDYLPSIEACDFDFAKSNLVSMDCLRLDKVHPFVSGNKWYKLKYSILHAYQAGKTRLLSFGGAYSNHLHALAYAGQHLNIKTIGVVRGERPATLSPTLSDCESWGMELHWVTRERYRQLSSSATSVDSVSPLATSHFQALFPDAWIVPEGGAGPDGVLGIEMLFNALQHAGSLDYDYIATPVGSGTTLAGLIRSKIGRAACLGFSALKGAIDLEQRVANQLEDADRVNDWSIIHDYHFGGFAKINPRLTQFISSVYNQHQFLLDPVYTGKMVYGLAELIHQGRIASGSKVLMIHTGGLQGWRGFGEYHPQHLNSVSADR